MQFNQGASVSTVDGKEVGRIDRVVIDPKTKKVADIVIRKGFLFTEDKVVPAALIAAGQKGRIILQLETDQLERLPNFRETHYIMLDEEELGRADKRSPLGFAPAMYWYLPYGEPALTPLAQLPYVAETETNIPEGTVALKEGAKVITRDGKHIGNVEQVLTSPRADRATHFLISKGLLLKEKKMVPVEWIEKFGEDKVRLAVGSRIIQQLPEYQHA
ncbi:MAG: PRC-barrel domain-containing protein [Chloroflexota bacterium]|nr:PRC-barrel domain-containing protein [Chloroflexota bacterium]